MNLRNKISYFINEVISDFRKQYFFMISLISLVTILFYHLDRFPFLLNHTPCIFKNITGIPCPGCGMGHGAICVLQGNLKAALHYNILIFPFLFCTVIGIAWMVVDIVRNKETFFPFLKRPFPGWIMILIIGVILLNWIWNIVRWH